MQKSDGFGIALIIATILFSPTHSYGDQALTRTFDNPRHGFSISLPDGWAQMPPERLESANQGARAQHPNWKPPALHYAYQMTNFAGLAFPPFVVIRVSDAPSDPKAVLEDMERDDLPQRVERGKPVFDEELNACLTQYQVEFAGMPTESWAAYFLTKRGVVKMFFYVPRANEQNLTALVKQIIKSVHISDEMKFTGAAPASPVGLIVALLAIGVIIFVLSRAKPAKCP
jgi:hypothetical protein